jgi:hypothetical protein
MTLTKEKALNTGYGRCSLEAQVVIAAPMSVRMLGEMHNFFVTVAAAVHKYNRESPNNDRVGMGYPEYSHTDAGILSLGNSVALIGSAAALEKILDSDRLKQFRLKGKKPVITTLERADDAKMAAFHRSRHNEASLPGEIARRIKRYEKRGKDTTNLRHELALSLGEIDEDELPKGFKVRKFIKESFLTIGDIRLAFRCAHEKSGKSPDAGSDKEPRVSTYGFSDPQAPLLFSMVQKASYDPKLFD